MNIDAFTIYLWQLADKLSQAFTGLTVGLGVLSVILLVASLMSRDSTFEASDETKAGLLKWARRSVVSTLLVLVFQSLIPSSNTIAMMVVIPKIADSKAIQQDLPDLYDAAVEALKSKLKGDEK